MGMGKLDGQVAIITGGGRGIGRAVAVAYAREGAAVVLCARGEADLAASVAAAEQAGGRAAAVVGDIGDPATGERLVKAAVDRFGGCDILVNAAAIGGPVGAVETLDPQAWSETLGINVTGTFLTCRAVLPLMKRNRRGRIINVSSGLAERVQPGQAAYSASKAAVVQFSRVAAEEVREFGVQVNAVHPGIVRTEMVANLLALPQAGVNVAILERLRALDADGKIIDPHISALLFLWLACECNVSGNFILFDEFYRDHLM